jgi:hypothetical protein
MEMLAEYGSRFKSINLTVDFPPSIRWFIESLTDGTVNSSGLLTELSMFYPRTENTLRSEGIYAPDDPQRIRLNSVMEALQVLRLRGIEINFTGASLRALIHLRLQEVQFNENLEIEMLLLALSSASCLQVLEIIKVISSADLEDFSSDSRLPIRLPELRTLYLEDLYSSFIELMLEVITWWSKLGCYVYIPQSIPSRG